MVYQLWNPSNLSILLESPSVIRPEETDTFKHKLAILPQDPAKKESNFPEKIFKIKVILPAMFQKKKSLARHFGKNRRKLENNLEKSHYWFSDF